MTLLGGQAYYVICATFIAQKICTPSLNYFSDRVATFQANTHTVRRTVMKGCPQGSCCGPGFWNIMYNALLNLEFSSHTKVIALQIILQL